MSTRKKHLSRSGLQTPPVRSKQEFLYRYLQGEFGNRTETWLTQDEFLGVEYDGLVCLRSRQIGGDCHYDLTPEDALRIWNSLLKGGYYLSAKAPDDKLTFQGEVVQSAKSLNLLFSTVKLPMREALASSSENVNGAVAQLMLEYYLNPKSMDWLNHLLVEYPLHAIEFSCYSCYIGNLRGFNTLFWEVRHY